MGLSSPCARSEYLLIVPVRTVLRHPSASSRKQATLSILFLSLPWTHVTIYRRIRREQPFTIPVPVSSVVCRESHIELQGRILFPEGIVLDNSLHGRSFFLSRFLVSTSRGLSSALVYVVGCGIGIRVSWLFRSLRYRFVSSLLPLSNGRGDRLAWIQRHLSSYVSKQEDGSLSLGPIAEAEESCWCVRGCLRFPSANRLRSGCDHQHVQRERGHSPLSAELVQSIVGWLCCSYWSQWCDSSRWILSHTVSYSHSRRKTPLVSFHDHATHYTDEVDPWCVCYLSCLFVIRTDSHTSKSTLSNLRMDFIIESEKKEGPTEIWTRIAGFRVLSANHYTMGPCHSSLPPPYQCVVNQVVFTVNPLPNQPLIPTNTSIKDKLSSDCSRPPSPTFPAP